MQRRKGSTATASTSPQQQPTLIHTKPHRPVQPPQLTTNTPPPLSDMNDDPGLGGGYQRFSSPAPPQASAGGAFQSQHQPHLSSQQHPGPAGFQGYPQQMPQQQQQQQFNPFVAPSMPWANDATAQMGVQFGRHAFNAGQDYVERNFTRHLPVSHLQHAFNVSNLYVLRKIRLVLFPWRHSPWARIVKRSEMSGQAEGYWPPREDLNSPDLYIPVMALVTYILLSGIVAGSQERFGPELLGSSASRALGIIFLEFCIIKLGTYLLNIGGKGTMVDLVAYSGYKFIGIILTLLADLLQLGRTMYWTVFIYVFCANFFFLLRSLRYVILDHAPSAAPASLGSDGTQPSLAPSQKTKRLQFLFGIAITQSLSMWVLSRV